MIAKKLKTLKYRGNEIELWVTPVVTEKRDSWGVTFLGFPKSEEGYVDAKDFAEWTWRAMKKVFDEELTAIDAVS